MRSIVRTELILFLALFTAPVLAAPGDRSPDGVFTEIPRTALKGREARELYAFPESFRAFEMDRTAFDRLLGAAARNVAERSRQERGVVALPMPDGTYRQLRVEAAPIMAKGLAARYPRFKSYRLGAIDGSGTTGRMLDGPLGLHVLLFTAEGAVRIDVHSKGDLARVISYFDRDLPQVAEACGTDERGSQPESQRGFSGLPPSCPSPAGASAPEFECSVYGSCPGTTNCWHQDTGYTACVKPDQTLFQCTLGQTVHHKRCVCGSVGDCRNADSHLACMGELRVYRLALATTSEFFAQYGDFSTVWTVVLGLVSDLNVIYERDASVSFELVAGNWQLLFDDVVGDGYPDPVPPGSDCAIAISNANAAVIDAHIGFTNYDIGHVLETCGYGVGGGAICGSRICTGDHVTPCTATSPDCDEAGGVCSSPKANGASLGTLRNLAHEIGHQFSAGHTFSGSACNQDAFDAGAAYEPGSGSTIMSYWNTCGTDNIGVPESDTLYLHIDSIERITSYASGLECGSVGTGTVPPVVQMPAGFTVPRDTPFTLSGSATAGTAGDTLTYTWEQHDLDPDKTVFDADVDPLFRSKFPLADGGTREFLDLATPGSILPTTDRPLNMRLVVRETGPFGVGAVAYGTTVVAAHGAPFAVTYPVQGTVITSSPITVTWDRGASTTLGMPRLDILLSRDGGAFQPLIQNTLNDGSQQVSINLCPSTNNALIKLAKSGVPFFALSGRFQIHCP